MLAVDPMVSELKRLGSLRDAVRRGLAHRVKGELYVSDAGSFRGKVPNSVLIASKIVDDAVISHHTALEVHAVAHSQLETAFFTTPVKVPNFRAEGYRFRRVAPPPVADVILREYETRVPVGDSLVTVTTPERTLVDCLAGAWFSGGPEELLRSVGGFSSMSAERAWRYAQLLDSPSVTARLGWVLELFASRWGPDPHVLQQMRSCIVNEAYWLGVGQPPTRFVSRWQLYLPVGMPYAEWARG